MRICSIELTNFCRHRHLAVDFHPGLNAVIGPNGSGKSTVLHAAYIGLTNDYSRLSGVKADNVCQLAPSGESSNIKLVFEHGGTTCEVVRHISPNAKGTLVVNGGERILGDQGVNARVLEILGVTPQILSQYAIVGQGEMFAPLAAGSRDRAVAFQRLFGTDHAEACWKAIGDWLSDNSTITVPDTEEVELVLREQNSRVETLDNELATVLEIFDYANQDPATHPCHGLLREYEGKLAAVQQREQSTRTKESVSHQLRSVEPQAAAFLSQSNDLAASLEDLRTAADSAAAGLSAWDRYDTYSQNLNSLRVQVEQRQAELESAQSAVPSPPNGLLTPTQIEASTARLDELKARIHSDVQVSRYFHENSEANCPTCGTPASTIAPVVAEIDERLPALQDEASSLRSALDATREFNNQVSRSQAAVQNKESVLANVSQQLSEFEALSVEQPPLTREQYTSAIHQLRIASACKTQVDAQLGQVQVQMANANGQIEVLEQQIAESTAIIAACSVTQEDYESATQERNRLLGGATRYQNLVGQLTQARSVATQTEARLVGLREQAAQATRLLRFREHIGEVRNVLHRDNLPRIASQHYLEMLVGEINSVLHLFDSDFTVEAEEGLAFTAHFHDGRVQSMTRLSGGQKIVLSWAFRIAVNMMFAGNLGLIGLDEPTEFLDEHNIERVQQALGRLRELSSSRGLQCVMVTHERSLAPLFDKVERLDA